MCEVLRGGAMATPQSEHEMLGMVLADLDAICEKLSESSAVALELRLLASEFAMEFTSLTRTHPFQGAALLIRMVRFLPRLLDVQAKPARVSG